MLHPSLAAKLSCDGKVAVVTGGGGGIGRGISLALGKAGARVVVADLVTERAEEAAAAIRSEGGDALPVTMDAMDPEQVAGLIATADERYGRLDILINNAGGSTSRAFLKQTERSWQRHIELNLLSVFRATSAAAAVMIRGGRGGAIVNVSSIEGVRAAPTFAVYAACKAGMESFTKSMALELGAHNIRVNAIAPDHTLTPGIMGNRTGPVDPTVWRRRSEAEVDALLRIIPLGREGVEEECGDAALFLVSGLAAYITGVTLPVDGGTSASSGWMRDLAGKWTLNEGMVCTAD